MTKKKKVKVKTKAKGNGKEATQFKPGKSGNPNGRPPYPQEYKELQKLTVADYKLKVDKYLQMTSEEIKKAIESKDDIPVIDKWLLSCISNGMANGVYTMLDKLLNRSLGMPSQKIELSHTNKNKAADIEKMKQWRKQRIKQR
jgi:hypothetical protein